MALDLHKNHLCLALKSAKQLLDKELNGYISADRSNPDYIFANARTVNNFFKRLCHSFDDRISSHTSVDKFRTWKPVMDV